LKIIDTPISSIEDELVFYGINNTLQELHLLNSKLNIFPKVPLQVSSDTFSFCEGRDRFMSFISEIIFYLSSGVSPAVLCVINVKSLLYFPCKIHSLTFIAQKLTMKKQLARPPCIYLLEFWIIFFNSCRFLTCVSPLVIRF
jgi:hypothetical protein